MMNLRANPIDVYEMHWVACECVVDTWDTAEGLWGGEDLEEDEDLEDEEGF